MKFNAKQIEGFVKFLDTMTASAFIGAIVGGSGHTIVTPFELFLLWASALGCMIGATVLRSEK